MNDLLATAPESRSLRPFTIDDEKFMEMLATDPRVTRYVGNGGTWSTEYVHRRVTEALTALPGAHPAAARWFIGLEAGHRVGVVVSSRRGSCVEVGYWVCPDAWGRGIAGWMLGAALAPIRSVFGDRELLGRVLPGNDASIRVLESQGFMLDPSEGPELRYVRSVA